MATSRSSAQPFRTLALLIALIAGLLASPPATAAETPQRGVWSVENEAGRHLHTEAEAVEHARQADVITALPNSYRDHVPAMRAANPRLKLLVYMNAAFAYRGQGDTYPQDWYARDALGNKVRSTAFGNWLMDIRHAGWRADRVAECKRLITKSGYDGCFLDMVSQAPLVDGYLDAMPIDPSTGQAWTFRSWLSETGRILSDVRSALGSRPVMGNGVGTGRQYFRAEGAASVLTGSADMLVAESFVRTARQAPDQARPEAAWVQDVEMLRDAASKGTAIMVLSKDWTASAKEVKDRWHLYALATFMLGDDGQHFFRFSYGPGRDALTTHPWWSLSVGEPTGTYRKSGVVYERVFTHGRVVVNPTAAAITLALDTPHLDVSGTEVRTVVLAPHSAEILRSVDGGPTDILPEPVVPIEPTPIDPLPVEPTDKPACGAHTASV